MRVARVDVAEEQEVAALLARISAEVGRLDVAFNNAGITGGAHRIEDYPASDFEKVLRVNLTSVFLGMKYELPLMKRGGGGAICNTASVAAITGPGGMCAHAASKCGVHGLTRVAAMENAALNGYRSEIVRDAKAVVVGVTSNGFTRADPNDRGMLDVVGFDTSVPAVIADFVRSWRTATRRTVQGHQEETMRAGVNVPARPLDPLELQVVSLKESINISPNYGIST